MQHKSWSGSDRDVPIVVGGLSCFILALVSAIKLVVPFWQATRLQIMKYAGTYLLLLFL
jgi:hypothetical protein